jgi:ATP-dependent DNA ligase
VWCDGAGLAIFDKLHSRPYDGEVILYAFDLLELHGEDWRPRPLEERKARLARLLARMPAGIQYTEHLEGDGAAIFSHACRLGAEGIVSKHREHPYRSGPSKAWLKTKNPARLLRRDPEEAAGAFTRTGWNGSFFCEFEKGGTRCP